MTITPEIQAQLREPFAPEQVGNLPRITCPACTESATRVCSRHSKGRCAGCKQWLTDAHIHLSYVGHAAVTDRLLKVDPNWSWEPMYRNVDPAALVAAAATGDQNVVSTVIAAAPPLKDESGGMWILMTVHGTTRPGYGTTDSRGPDRQKMLISDAIRNAAMRFGVGLDMWSKEDLVDEPPLTGDAATRRPGPVPPPPGRDWIGEARRCADLPSLLQLSRQCNEAGAFEGRVREALLARRREFAATQEATR